jgi:hypothetical protein
LRDGEQLLLALYHHMHLTLHEIGHVIGLADSSVPIRYASVVLRLRARNP